MANPINQRGVFFIATGADYTEAAQAAARNVRRHAPCLPIAISTDLTESLDQDLFSHIFRIDDPHPRSKVDQLALSPFERTLYLDTDIRLLEDVSDLFDLLDRFDIALAHAHARNRDLTRETWRLQLPDSFPQLNGGVILFKASDDMARFFRDWSESYRDANFKKDQVTLRELIWLSPLRLYVLPPEYNIRYSRYLRFWSSTEAVPRLLHLALFHDDGQGAVPTAKRRMKEIGEDFAAAGRTLLGALAKIVTLGRVDGFADRNWRRSVRHRGGASTPGAAQRMVDQHRALGAEQPRQAEK